MEGKPADGRQASSQAVQLDGATMKMMTRAFTAFMLIVAALAVGGCATTRDSDIPWNAPASWEGSPYIPGFSQ